MKFPSKEVVARIRKEYPMGTRIELLEMDDFRLRQLERRYSYRVDDTGSLLVSWDTGSGLNVIYGVDRVRKLEEGR